MVGGLLGLVIMFSAVYDKKYIAIRNVLGKKDAIGVHSFNITSTY